MSVTFSSLDLDDRLVRALAKMGLVHPTKVQAESIPLSLAGKDVLVKSSTGSGKTAAYCLPIIQKILLAKSNSAALDSKTNRSLQKTRAVVLVPTRELSEQVSSYLSKLLLYCGSISGGSNKSGKTGQAASAIGAAAASSSSSSSASSAAAASSSAGGSSSAVPSISVINLSDGSSVEVQRTRLSDKPDIIVATPSRLLQQLTLSNSNVKLVDSLEMLVVDEADLVLSFGHEDDLKQLLSHFPRIYQTTLMSATLNKDVESVKQLMLRNPVVLDLPNESSSSSNNNNSGNSLDETGANDSSITTMGQLTQYVVKASEKDKFLLTFVILKLKLIQGKILIFVNGIDRCYRLRLFLEQFGIRSCVLNSEMPINSRFHIVEEFNKGVYDYIIATDEAALSGENDDEEDEEDEEDGDNGDNDDVDGEDGKNKNKDNEKKNAKKKSKSKTQSDKEYGVSRGVDFQDVACVVNFDFPTSSRSYLHRVGRTARGGKNGMSLSFIEEDSSSGSKKRKNTAASDNADDLSSTSNTVIGFRSNGDSATDSRVLRKVERLLAERNTEIKPYVFDMKQVDGFRYRLDDALRSVTRASIREARIKEVKREILTSERLRAHFDDKPMDFEFLRHDKALHPSRVQQHMRHIPEYLMPKIAPPAQNKNEEGEQGEQKGKNKPKGIGFVPFKKAKGGKRGGGNSGGGGGGRKGGDPLRSFSGAKRRK